MYGQSFKYIFTTFIKLKTFDCTQGHLVGKQTCALAMCSAEAPLSKVLNISSVSATLFHVSDFLWMEQTEKWNSGCATKNISMAKLLII